MAESHRRLLTRELEELLAGERETWSSRAVARAASRHARLLRPAESATQERLRDAWRGWLGADFVSRDTEGRRVHGLVTALALRMRELAPELLALREQVDPLAERAGPSPGRALLGLHATAVILDDVGTREAP